MGETAVFLFPEEAFYEKGLFRGKVLLQQNKNKHQYKKQKLFLKIKGMIPCLCPEKMGVHGRFSIEKRNGFFYTRY